MKNYTCFRFPVSLQTIPNGLYVLYTHVFHSRVEGEGAAKIIDVTFNTAEVTKVMDDAPQDGSTKMEFERMTTEAQEMQKEMKLLQIREEVLQNEKSFLKTYANHISKAQTLKVGVVRWGKLRG